MLLQHSNQNHLKINDLKFKYDSNAPTWRANQYKGIDRAANEIAANASFVTKDKISSSASLAPIAVEILLCRSSVQKIEAYSGKSSKKKLKLQNYTIDGSLLEIDEYPKSYYAPDQNFTDTAWNKQ